jgi:hypothetical protein
VNGGGLASRRGPDDRPLPSRIVADPLSDRTEELAAILPDAVGRAVLGKAGEGVAREPRHAPQNNWTRHVIILANQDGRYSLLTWLDAWHFARNKIFSRMNCADAGTGRGCVRRPLPPWLGLGLVRTS